MDAWIVVLGTAGIGQILLLLLLLLTGHPPHPVASLWLSLFLASVGATLAADVIDSLGLSLPFAFVTPLLTSALLLIGPTLWLYTRALTERRGIIKLSVALHFLPFALFSITLYSRLSAVPTSEIAAAVDPALDQNRNVAELLWLTPVASQILAYLAAVVWRVVHSRTQITDEFSNLEHRTLRWIILLCALVGLVLAAWVLSWGISHRASNLITTVGYLLAINLIGTHGLQQANVFQKYLPLPHFSLTPSAIGTESAKHESSESAIPSTEGVERAKYARATLPATLAEQLRAQLEERMQIEKPYLDEDLTLAELAIQIGASSHQLSQLFNQHLGESFYDYINRHRVAAFQRLASLTPNQNRPLLDIALDCGFGSKSTFNAVFKRQVGINPSAWRQQALRANPSVQRQRRQ